MHDVGGGPRRRRHRRLCRRDGGCDGPLLAARGGGAASSEICPRSARDLREICPRRVEVRMRGAALSFCHLRPLSHSRSRARSPSPLSTACCRAGARAARLQLPRDGAAGAPLPRGRSSFSHTLRSSGAHTRGQPRAQGHAAHRQSRTDQRSLTTLEFQARFFLGAHARLGLAESAVLTSSSMTRP